MLWSRCVSTRDTVSSPQVQKVGIRGGRDSRSFFYPSRGFEWCMYVHERIYSGNLVLCLRKASSIATRVRDEEEASVENSKTTANTTACALSFWTIHMLTFPHANATRNDLI